MHLSKHTSLYHSENGFTITELLVATGLLSLLALSGAQVMTNLNKSAKIIDSKGNSTAAEQTLRSYLHHENLCTAALAPMTLDPNGTNDLIFNLPDLGTFEKGTLNSKFNLITKFIKTSELSLAETNSIQWKIYLGGLHTAFAMNNPDGSPIDANGLSGFSFKDNTIGTISLMVDPSGKVVKCSMSGLTFNNVPQNTPINPSTSPYITSTHNSNKGSQNKSTCSSIEQCAVYDYYLRNGIPNAYASADEWMASNKNWKSIAGSYIDSMTGLGKLNFLASVNQEGLAQTGRQNFNGIAQRPDTIDQWVAEAVANDPSGQSMLTTTSGIQLLQKMFDAGSSTATNTQQILRTALTKSADLTMNSSLGIGSWVEALGFSNAQQFADNMPNAAIGSALSQTAASKQDPEAMLAVINYMNENPTRAVEIANGTGLWAKNVDGGVSAVTNYISSNLQNSGNNQTALTVAQATNQWSSIVGSQTVGSAINNNSSNALSIAQGTTTWNNAVGTSTVNQTIRNDPTKAASIANGTTVATQIFGQNAVNQAIRNNASLAADQASAIDRAKKAGYSDQQIKDYIKANPTSFQSWGR